MKTFPLVCALIFAGFQAQAKDLPPETLSSYNKAKIFLARFGNQQRQNLFNKVGGLRAAINRKVVGQDDLAAAFQMRLIQYLNSVGTRTGEPVAMHVIGLPGVGKTSLMEVLEELQFPVVKINAERFSSAGETSVDYYLMQALDKVTELKTSPDVPVILFIDELDKVPEKTTPEETVQAVITVLNEILSEGKVIDRRHASKKMDFSNVFVMTAMNFAPVQINQFAEEIIGKTERTKSFWEFNEQDMNKFDKWIRSTATSGQSAVAKVLELLFRSNTISRLIPDTIVAKTLSAADFDDIVKNNIQDVVARLSKDKNVQMKVNYTPDFLKFLRKVAVFAPSGARMSVKRVDLLVEQLVSVAMRADLNLPNTLMLPREINLDYDARAKKAVVQIQAFSKTNSKTNLVANQSIDVSYNAPTGSFEFPLKLLKPLPADLSRMAEEYAAREAAQTLSPGEIRALRDSYQNNHALAKHLKEWIFDQDELIDDLDENLHVYMSSKEPGVRFQTIPGFSGTGKTATIIEGAAFLDLPVVRMNMQEYAGESQESADKFGKDLFDRIANALEESPTGKYIILLEELDKAYEIDPKSGGYVTRPVMAYVKDLLSLGQRTINVESGHSVDEQKELDITGAYTILTLNFPTDRFNLKADPRQTTIEDMQKLVRNISGSPEQIRGLFSELFLPDTINRLLSGLSVKVPNALTERGYLQIINNQVDATLFSLSGNASEAGSIGAIKIKLSKSYLKQYLFAEAVIPSEGGRQAEQAAKTILLKNIITAIQNLPKDSILYRRPIEIGFDFKPATSKSEPTVVATARLSEKEDQLKAGSDLKQKLFSEPQELRFPPLARFNDIPAVRIYVAAHEFGHAFGAVMSGYRIRYMTCVGDGDHVGGYVRPRGLEIATARGKLADLLFTIGSRAMERIIFSNRPTEPGAVLDIAAGAVQDIAQATKLIWDIVHQFGMDPGGGVIERSGLQGHDREEYAKRNYFFSELSDEKVAQLGLVVRDMEDFLVEQMLKAHDKQWYIERITTFAQKGEYSEAQFYEALGYKHPGENDAFLGESSTLETQFSSIAENKPDSVKTARVEKQGAGFTAAQNMDQALAAFEASLKKRLHPEECRDLLTVGRSPE